jgi:hypothetical protein
MNRAHHLHQTPLFPLHHSFLALVYHFRNNHNWLVMGTSITWSLCKASFIHVLFISMLLLHGKHGWCSSESRLAWCHMGVHFVVDSLTCFKGFSLGSPVFLPPQKSTFLNSNWIQWNHYMEPLLNPIYFIYWNKNSNKVMCLYSYCFVNQYF